MEVFVAMKQSVTCMKSNPVNHEVRGWQWIVGYVVPLLQNKNVHRRVSLCFSVCAEPRVEPSGGFYKLVNSLPP